MRALNVGLTVLGGPMLAVLLLGVLTRRANGKGALVGLVVGATLTVWLFVGSTLHRSGICEDEDDKTLH